MYTLEPWRDVPQHVRADGISNKWIGCDDNVFHLSGFMEGAEGVFISAAIRGLVHRPFKSVWHEPAYGAPRFERTVDERREISTRIAICSDSQFGWQDAETKFWNGMNGDTPGWWSTFTRRTGELWLPMQLAEAVQTELSEDPGYRNFVQEWDILLAADGEPRWRMPDVAPADWVNDMSITTKVKRDESKIAPEITVGVGKFKVANRGTAPSWPVFTVSAPGRCWLPDGVSGRMVRVPPLEAGEHIIVDTNPENRIAISALDPVDDWGKQIIRNSELLSWLFGQYGDSGITVLERFHGQGFTQPIQPGTVATLPVWHDTKDARVSVRLPQRYERSIS